MSLYRYVPGEAELIALMVDAVHASTPPLPDKAMGWRARLEAAARNKWAMYHRHPWLLQVASGRPLLGPNTRAATEAYMQIFDGSGLDARDIVDVISMVSAFVSGLARSTLDATRAADDTGISDEQWWTAQQPFLERALADDDTSMIAKIVSGGGFDEWGDRTFEFGLQRVLDGIEAYLAWRAETQTAAVTTTSSAAGQKS